MTQADIASRNEKPMFKKGDLVVWRSSNAKKIGTIVDVLPSGVHPHDHGWWTIGKDALQRRHESYIVRGRIIGTRKSALYWPVVSLLRRREGVLSVDEIDWCHQHAEEVRKLISQTVG